MQNPVNEKPRKESPFWGVLAEAQEIEIREVDLATSPRDCLETILGEFDSDQAQPARRAFVVRVKPRVSIEETRAASKQLLLNATYVLENAEVLLKSGELVLARHLFAYLLKDHPTEPRALRGLGICLLRLGDIIASRKCFKALMDLRPTPADCPYWVAQCYLAEGNNSLALHYFKKVAQPQILKPTEQFFLHKEMGNCLTRLDRLEEAQGCYDQALVLNPDSDTIHVNLGTLELQRRNATAAQAHFEAALRLNAQNPKALCGIGLTQFSQGDTTAAQTQFLAALDLDSQNSVALHHLVKIAYEVENFDAAKARLKAFLLKAPLNIDMRFALAAILFREKNFPECERELEKNLSSSPHHKRSRELFEEIRSHKHRTL